MNVSISAMYMFKGSEHKMLNNKNIYALNKLLAEMCRENGYEFRRLSTGEEDREILSRCGAHFMLPDAEQGGH